MAVERPLAPVAQEAQVVLVIMVAMGALEPRIIVEQAVAEEGLRDPAE